MEEQGHVIVITAREKEITYYLLQKYSFPYFPTSHHKLTTIDKIFDYINRWWNTYKICRKEKPDIALGVASFYIAQIGRLLGFPSIIFDDSEPSPIEIALYKPFATNILTPSRFQLDFGKKHIRYKGYHEFAYLHPNHFKPDQSVLDMLGVEAGEDYLIMRFVGWHSLHDRGISGIDIQTKIKAINKLSEFGKVFITSEIPLSKRLQKYQITIPPEKIHDALYYATLLVGDTQTMTTEAAILGTPAIRSNSFIGPKDMTNFIELEDSYGLIYNIRNEKKALYKAIELLENKKLKTEWKIKRRTILNEKIDVCDFIVWFVNNFPASVNKLKTNPDYQHRFIRYSDH